MRDMRNIFYLIAFALLAMGCHISGDRMLERYDWQTLTGDPPLVIAHRGNSHDFPEHSLAGYDYAIGQDADYIETDIVLTKDGVPICRHDLYLAKTTNIATLEEFADRKQRIGQRDDWCVMDLTLEDIKKLKTVQRYAHLPTHQNTLMEIPTLNELFELIWEAKNNRGGRARDTRRPMGILIEIKSPAAHRVKGYDLSRAVLDVIEHHAKKGPLPPIILQCFDRAEVVRLLDMTDLPVVLLSSKPVDLNTLPDGLAGLALKKDLLELKDGKSAVLDAIHKKGLAVYCWTFRLETLLDEEEPGKNTPQVFQTQIAEITPYLLAGVDGVIVDNPSWATMSRLDKIADPEGKHKWRAPNPMRSIATWWFFNVKLRHLK